MTRMLGPGSPGGWCGVQGVGRSLLPFFVSLAWVALEVAGLEGRGV